MFIGEHRHTIDEKGRLQIPAKWRSKLAAEGAVITKGFDGSLKLYPLPVWEEMAAKLAALPQSQPEARAYARQVLAGAVDVELDKLGRIVLPHYLRTYGNLVKPVVLAGLHDHVEVWSETAWVNYMDGIDQADPNFSQALKEYGI